MKLNITKEWLARQLARGDDSTVGTGGSDLDSLRKDVERRTVTPPVLSDIPSQLGRAVRFVREQRGWTPEDLARIADIEVREIVQIESTPNPQLTPRSAVYLADALGFSRRRLQEMAGHLPATAESKMSGDNALRFAARSGNISDITDDQYEITRAMVAVLAEREVDD